MVQGISVVIPNYNGISLFANTLPSVFEAVQNSGKPFEIIVVDDCSTDSSVEFLQLNYPNIRLLQNTVNGGFSVTANRGIRAAHYDKVLLLNSDVKLTPDYFANQYKFFELSDTFGVMGRIVGWEDEIVQDGAKYPAYHGSKIKTSGNYLLREEQLMEEGLYTVYLSGANAFIDKEKFLRIGGLNEIFSPFYVEDYELSLRAWRLGYKCYYDYNSVCRHQVSTSIRSKSKKEYINTIYNRNKMYLHAIHLDGVHLLLWYVQLLLELLLRTITFKWYYLSSFGMFMRSFKQVREARQALRELSGRTKLITVREVKAFILKHIKGSVVRF